MTPYRRAIPAWAGKPQYGRLTHGHGKGHPRVGGETYDAKRDKWCFQGAIPAWAGKPSLRTGSGTG